MKKILGIIVLIGLLVLIGFGFTYKMVEPDGWDRVVETVVEKVPVLENIVSEKTPAPQPTATPTPAPEVTVAPDVGENSDASHRKEESSTATAKPSATPAPTATPAPSATPEASATPSPTPEMDFDNMTYEVYVDLPGEIQEQYYDSFASPKEFFEWYNKAKEEYEKENPTIEIDGPINLENYLNGSDEGN